MLLPPSALLLALFSAAAAAFTPFTCIEWDDDGCIAVRSNLKNKPGFCNVTSGVNPVGGDPDSDSEASCRGLAAAFGYTDESADLFFQIDDNQTKTVTGDYISRSNISITARADVQFPGAVIQTGKTACTPRDSTVLYSAGNESTRIPRRVAPNPAQTRSLGNRFDRVCGRQREVDDDGKYLDGKPSAFEGNWRVNDTCQVLGCEQCDYFAKTTWIRSEGVHKFSWRNLTNWACNNKGGKVVVTCNATGIFRLERGVSSVSRKLSCKPITPYDMASDSTAEFFFIWPPALYGIVGLFFSMVAISMFINKQKKATGRDTLQATCWQIPFTFVFFFILLMAQLTGLAIIFLWITVCNGLQIIIVNEVWAPGNTLAEKFWERWVSGDVACQGEQWNRPSALSNIARLFTLVLLAGGGFVFNVFLASTQEESFLAGFFGFDCANGTMKAMFLLTLCYYGLSHGLTLVAFKRNLETANEIPAEPMEDGKGLKEATEAVKDVKTEIYSFIKALLTPVRLVTDVVLPIFWHPFTAAGLKVVGIPEDAVERDTNSQRAFWAIELILITFQSCGFGIRAMVPGFDMRLFAPWMTNIFDALAFRFEESATILFYLIAVGLAVAHSSWEFANTLNPDKSIEKRRASSVCYKWLLFWPFLVIKAVAGYPKIFKLWSKLSAKVGTVLFMPVLTLVLEKVSNTAVLCETNNQYGGTLTTLVWATLAFLSFRLGAPEVKLAKSSDKMKSFDRSKSKLKKVYSPFFRYYSSWTKCALVCVNVFVQGDVFWAMPFSIAIKVAEYFVFQRFDPWRDAGYQRPGASVKPHGATNSGRSNWWYKFSLLVTIWTYVTALISGAIVAASDGAASELAVTLLVLIGNALITMVFVNKDMMWDSRYASKRNGFSGMMRNPKIIPAFN